MDRMRIQMNQTSKEEQRYKLNRLKEAIDAEQLLSSLGFDVSRNNPSEVRAPCKIHGGDNKSSFRMNKLTKTWVCFSHGCHEEIGYDVISLVMHTLNMSFPDAVRYLENLTGIDVNDESAFVEFQRARERREFIEQRRFDNRQVPEDFLTEEYLKGFGKFRSDFFEHPKNGGFTKDILDLFEIGGGYVDKYGFQRDVIPIRDINGNLKGYSCRDVTGKADEDYKYLLTKGFDKDKVLYNLHKAKDYSGKSKTIIVVEGFKSVWKLHMAGYKNAVSCMGSSITSGQQSLLYSYAFNVVLLLDFDKAGVKGTVRAIEDMGGKIYLAPLFIGTEDKDPADHSIEELKILIGGTDEQD